MGRSALQTQVYARAMTLANRLKMYAERGLTTAAPAEEQPKQTPKKRTAASRKRKDTD